MFFAVVALLASTSFAQLDSRLWGARNVAPMMKTSATTHTPMAALTMAKSIVKAAGDTITNFPWNEGFENGTPGWTIIENDNDGICWQLSDTSSQIASFAAQYPRTGNACIIALSYSNFTYEALTPDEWLISPALVIPTGEDYTLTFYDNGTNPQYAAEHYAVHVATEKTVSALSATTPVLEQTLSLGEWVKRTVDLSAYAGQTIYIGFHHYGCTDQFCLGIDDIRVGGAETPEVTVEGPAIVEVNTAATFTATGASSFTWSVDGTTQSATGNTLTYTFTTTGNHSVVAEASNAAGSDSDTLYVNVYSCDEAVTANPWEEDFEGNTDCWHYVFGNATDSVWIYNNAQYAHSGSNFIVFLNDTNNTVADGWAISPKLTIPSSLSNVTLSYYIVRSEATDHLQVLVSTTATTDTADFTLLYDDATATVSGYERRVIDMSSYAGETVRIAFHNMSVGGQYLMQLDDIRLGGMELPELEVEGPVTVIAGNAATYVAHSDVSTLSWEVNGTLQSSTTDTLVYTFPAAGSYTVKVGATNAAGTAYDSLMVTAVECNAITSFPYSENFEAENPCWQFVSIDPANDGHIGLNDEEAFQGNYSYALSSYSRADDYNQYLISPELTLPATGHYMVKFWYMGYDASDAFRVLASTTTTDINAFTTVLGDNPTVATEWTEAGYVLPEGTKYIAINYYGNYAYYLYIDSLTIDELSAPSATINGPTSGKVGYSYTFTANATVAETYAWTVDGTAAGTEESLTYAFDTPGNHTIGLTVGNSTGSADATPLTINIISCDAHALPYIVNLDEGFGTCWDREGWDTITMGGNTYAYSMSAQSVFGMYMMDLHQDNWLVTEPLTMPESGSYSIKWKAFTYTSAYPTDHYSVYIINGDDTTQVFAETLTANDTMPQQRQVAIPSSVNGTFKVAFRHHDCEGGYVLMLEDIKVADPAGIDAVNTVNVAIYPNPAYDVLNIEGEGIRMVEMFDVNGRSVLTSMTAGQINMANFVNGVYVVRVTTDNGIRTEKVVKK